MPTAFFTGCVRPPRAPLPSLGSPRHGEPSPAAHALLRKSTGKHNISMRSFCFLPDEGGQHLFRKQPHLPVDLIDPLVAEQPYIPKGAHQMV